MRTLSTATSLLIGMMMVLCSQVLAESLTSLNFDNLVDGTSITNQFQGVAFQNAMAISAGITLNEFEFPPHSGSNVVSDGGGPITITFSPPVPSFSGYFTYSVPLTVQAFSSSAVNVAVANSRFSNNESLSGAAGSQPNELIQVESTIGIAQIVITGAPTGTSFTLDDITPSSFSHCDIDQDGNINVSDVQLVINQALGLFPAVADLNRDGMVNVADVQIEIDAALGLGCSAV